MQNLGQKMSKQEIEFLIDEIDIDGDGEITKTEFVEGYLRLMK